MAHPTVAAPLWRLLRSVATRLVRESRNDLQHHDVCMLVRNDHRHDSRVQREAAHLAKRGARVLVVAEAGGNATLPQSEQRDGYDVVRVVAPWRRPLASAPWLAALRRAGGRTLEAVPLLGKAVRRAETLAATVWYYTESSARVLYESPAAVHCHDLDTLLPGWLASAAGGRQLIYDSHELWTERSSMRDASLTQRLSRQRYALLERLLIRRADTVFTVSEGIADELRRRYGIRRPTLLRNLPELPEHLPRRSLRKAAGGRGPILLHLGMVDADRGLAETVRALTELPHARLVLLGHAQPQPLADLLQLAVSLGVGERVLHLPPVPRGEVLAWARGADVGLCLLRPVCLNHVHCLPNKFFEYAIAGIPIVASDVPELRAWVRKYKLGTVCDAADPHAIAHAVGAVLSGQVPLASPAERKKLRAESSWEREAEKLVQAYPWLQPCQPVPRRDVSIQFVTGKGER